MVASWKRRSFRENGGGWGKLLLGLDLGSIALVELFLEEEEVELLGLLFELECC